MVVHRIDNWPAPLLGCLHHETFFYCVHVVDGRTHLSSLFVVLVDYYRNLHATLRGVMPLIRETRRACCVFRLYVQGSDCASQLPRILWRVRQSCCPGQRALLGWAGPRAWHCIYSIYVHTASVPRIILAPLLASCASLLKHLVPKSTAGCDRVTAVRSRGVCDGELRPLHVFHIAPAVGDLLASDLAG
jgi:hypothetical protein